MDTPARLDEHDDTDEAPPFRIAMPEPRTVPVVVASPHSGRAYPSELLAVSRLDAHTLRRSEDCFVDELLFEAAACGLPLIAAEFPRAWCDVNREPWELDPAMFSDRLPAWCTTRSPRIEAGFGTIARLVSSGQPIYGNKLRFADAEERIRSCWLPYHAALSGLIDETRTGFGGCVLLDVHSMPTDTVPPAGDAPHFVLGDVHGTSCDRALRSAVAHVLETAGYRIRYNDPYAGGYVTRHYGRPRLGVHALQIEIARALYMDQRTYRKSDGFPVIRDLMTIVLRTVADLSPELVGG
ncbi:MAG: N-formylglutamate amidohydrolase [Gluconacetobacter diazotrophicus]|nr:N-formylglutamate amidohydrolase [Gluconacetobacter diazotrophicus]